MAGERGCPGQGWLDGPHAETRSLSSGVGRRTPPAHPSRAVRLESVDGSVARAWRYPAWGRAGARAGERGEHHHGVPTHGHGGHCPPRLLPLRLRSAVTGGLFDGCCRSDG